VYPFGKHSKAPAPAAAGTTASPKNFLMVVVEKAYAVRVEVVVTTAVTARLLRLSYIFSLGTEREEAISGMIESLCSTASTVGTNLYLRKTALIDEPKDLNG